MFLAEAASSAAPVVPANNFSAFDIFMLVFTLLILLGLVRQLSQRPRKNKFAIGFATVALLVFLFADVIMVKGWLA